MLGSGSSSSMNKVLKENRRLRKRSLDKYKRIKESYIGIGNDYKISPVQLTPEQKAKARKRVENYYKQRNQRILFQLLVVATVVVSLVIWGTWKLLA